MTIIETSARTLAGIFSKYVTPRNLRVFEGFVIRLAVLFFIGHLGIIFLLNKVPGLYRGESFDYLKAIYTPFSFILAYEVFLLVVILPESMSEFIGKQFEIITLITLRSFFHDIADVHVLSPLKLSDPAVISLGYDLIASVIMLVLMGLFHRLHHRYSANENKEPLERFITFKKAISLCLLIFLVITSIVNLQAWISHTIYAFTHKTAFPNPNEFFYLDFFNVMIYADVLLLIISFLYDSSFNAVMRNASFIISTILLRFSLSMHRPDNHILTIISFAFSIAVMFALQFKQKNSPSPDNPH